jgi:hypothetical protein
MIEKNQTPNAQRPTLNAQLKAPAPIVRMTVIWRGSPLPLALVCSDLDVGRWALGLGRLRLR